jgi:hypothetical protein
MVSPGHDAVVLARAPDAGVLHPGGEVLVHLGGGIGQGAAPANAMGSVKSGFCPGALV